MHTPAFSINNFSDFFFSEVLSYSLTKPSHLTIAFEYPQKDSLVSNFINVVQNSIPA
jgi:hypothetical protein